MSCDLFNLISPLINFEFMPICVVLVYDLAYPLTQDMISISTLYLAVHLRKLELLVACGGLSELHYA